MPPVLRAGLIGIGSMGRNHARLLHSLADVEFVVICDPDGDRFGAALGIPIVPTVEELLTYSLDYCVVATPTSTHEEVALLLAASGVHAMIEKPLAGSVEAAARIAAAFESAGLVGAVGHIERYNPALRDLKRRLKLGEIGEIYQVATRRQGPFPTRIADVGVIKDLATHDIDLTQWVTGRAYELVSAQTANRSGRDHEDLVAATGLLQGGIITNHLVNWLSPMKERLTLVTGELGTFEASTLSGDLTFYANGTCNDWPEISHFRGVSEGDVIRYAIRKPEPLRTEHEAFRDAVLGHQYDIVSLREGVEIVRVADAFLSAARSGITVSLPPLTWARGYAA